MVARTQLARPDTSDRPFGLPNRELITTIVDLPPPPSVNRSRRVDWAAHAGHKKWVKHADHLMMFIPKANRLPVKGRFELLITLDEKQIRSDADNVLKSLIDYLRRVELIVDDSPKYMRRLVVEWGQVTAGCRVSIQELA